LKKECAKFKEIAHLESQLAIDEGVGTDLIQCEKCQQNNCSYSELQTLSGDEPMTLFILCRNCGYRWRG
jgi:transcription elongation factor S-II